MGGGDVDPRMKEKQMRKLFDAIDLDKSDSVCFAELGDGLRSIGLRPTEAAMNELWQHMQKHDIDGDGALSFDEFTSFCHVQEERLLKQFKSMDTDADGHLTVDELHAALKGYGIETERSSVVKNLKLVDPNGDGKLSFEEFRRLALLTPNAEVGKVFAAGEGQFHFGYYSIPKSDEKSSHSPATIFCSGGMAGLISRTMTAPADRIKVTMQASTEKGGTIGSTIRAILKEGPTSFWKGNGTNVIKIIPESGIKFFANDFFRDKIVSDKDNVRAHERLLAGSCAGVTAQSLIYPMEVVKTRLALAPPGLYSGIAGCFTKIVRDEGLISLYKGLGASNVGIIPYAGVDLAVYGTLKAQWFTKYGPDCPPEWYHMLLMGAASSFTGQVCAYPLQLIRTRLQSSGLPGRKVYGGMGDVVRDVMASEGPRGFYRGIGANFMKGIPAVAIGYVAYEKSVQFFEKRLD